MGKSNRERIERIRQGLELPRSIKALLSTEKNANNSTKDIVLVKTKCPDITNLTEIKACVRIIGMLGNPMLPKQVICDKTKQGMYQVVTKLKKYGETSDSIFEFYWNIPQFQDMWSKIGCDKSEWQKIVQS